MKQIVFFVIVGTVSLALKIFEPQICDGLESLQCEAIVQYFIFILEILIS